MNRRLLRFLSVAVVLAATSASHAGNVVWNNTIGGNWSATGNWNPHRVPTSTDVAIITNNGNYTVTVDIDADVGGLILGYTNATAQVLSANGKVFSLSGAATINPSGRFNLTASSFNSDTNGSGATISGTLNASSAVLSGRMTLATNGIMTFSNTGSSFNSLALTNNGTVNWYQANLTNTGTSIVVNEGVWDAKTNNSLFSSSGTIAFNNHGTLRKSGGFLTDSNGTSFGSGVVFSNTGSLDILSGKLTAQNVNVSGTFNINSNAALELYG
ncbi:MAG TPA: hypothetical protein VN625_04090, partial [Desulfuromonadaceae bacterium]|nr:hypothetical protein [Desulfuromonadaceae bacterium]